LRAGGKGGRAGIEGGAKWSPQNGIQRTGQISGVSSGAHAKLDDKGQVKLGINYGLGSGGLIMNLSFFGNLFDTWMEMLGLDSNSELDSNSKKDS
jgi:hypothetical protein